MNVVEYGVGEINAEGKFEETEAHADGAVLATECLVRGDVEDLAPLPVLSLPCHCVDIVVTVHEEPAVTVGAGEREEPLFEPTIE